MSTELLNSIRNAPFRQYLRDLLVEICQIDTTPDADVSVMRQRESAVFDILERELRGMVFPGARIEHRTINPEISSHGAYSQLHYTKTDDRCEGLTPAEAYAGRFNLLFLIDGVQQRDAGENLAVNAHIDVVAPYFPPRVENGVVHGRGACDDKGNVVVMIGALRAVAQHLKDADLQLNRHLTNMFVIDEEPGGNGSLSLALDRELKQRYDSMLVLECCDHRLHPANRGAVWYRLDVFMSGVSQFEMAAFVIEQLEKEGRAIRSESRHDLFPQRPVQTCHGMIDDYGEHPSRICGHVAFRIDFASAPEQRAETLVRDCLEFAVAEYIGLYGDKTQVLDAATGQPKVDRHYDVRREGNSLIVDVHGSTGHMGSILENDGAITKMATLVRALVLSKPKLEALVDSPVVLELAGRENHETLKLEGGQGFVPTHPIDEVMRRLIKASERGAEAYLSLIEKPGSGSEAVRVSYEKLHNAAFDGDPDSAAMRRAIAAARECGIWRDDEHVTGWTVSCDARLFATEHPDMPVITSGAGRLEHAHSDSEQLSLDDLVKSVEFVALYMLQQTGTI